MDLSTPKEVFKMDSFGDLIYSVALNSQQNMLFIATSKGIDAVPISYSLADTVLEEMTIK